MIFSVKLKSYNLLFCVTLLSTISIIQNFTFCLLDTSTTANPCDWRAVLGEHNLEDNEVFQQSRGVEAIYLHPKYQFGMPPDYDIGELHSLHP